MNNTELTLDQLSEVAGGGVFAKLDGFKQVIHPNYRPRGFDIGPVARNSRISAEPLPSPAPIGIDPIPFP